jgi:hypothetical protein
MMNSSWRRIRATAPALVMSTLALSATSPVVSARAGDDPKQVVTVAFGAGLNTAQQGNEANHHIIPKVIHVKQGGVVNFAVAGFHWIFVYNPGVKVEDIQAFLETQNPAPTFVNFEVNKLYYMGINPAVAPPPGPPLSNAFNRIETVSFSKKGTYLVICNVTEHFEDGMYAIVKVTDDDRDDGDHDHHGGR